MLQSNEILLATADFHHLIHASATVTPALACNYMISLRVQSRSKERKKFYISFVHYSVLISFSYTLTSQRKIKYTNILLIT